MAKFLFLLVSPMFVCAAARMCNGLFGVSNHANPLFSFRFHFFFSSSDYCGLPVYINALMANFVDNFT